ncbi:hypothetical protein H7F15_06270 [Pontibacter sp. Tf4]|uniref:hypothetical protein n=1 Tax=Pontibacter sp. Tf4 TaxID=2761620 RepID=UPI0016280F75|nr:hypothetical protein [Pontibacter sp. Tf4]MBB6610634.1 hypothetical protein [Pontibacter sp. Tf4]
MYSGLLTYKFRSRLVLLLYLKKPARNTTPIPVKVKTDTNYSFKPIRNYCPIQTIVAG